MDNPTRQQQQRNQPQKSDGEGSHGSEMKCKICYDNPLGVVFLPCAHLVTCERCVLYLSSCPLCREKITMTIRIFLS